MGLLDFLKGIKKPDPSTPVLPKDNVKQNILAINRDTAPFQIRSGEDEGVDLIAEWKIVDAKWMEIFAKAGIKEVFKILIVLDDAQKEARMVDKAYGVAWRAGVASLTASASAFRGQKMEISGGTAYAFTEEFKPGQVYNYRFNTGEMKKPLDQAILDSGWTVKKVAFGKLK
jgi:hypothetical protein